MCVPKDSEIVRNKRGTKSVDMPDQFYKDLWSTVASIDAKEMQLKGMELKEFTIAPDGSFQPV